MAEYIDRKAVEEMIENAEYIAPAFGLCGGYCMDDIDLSSIPTADVAPVVHGKWITCDWMYECDICHCQINKGLFKANINFCPNCGAKMDLEE